MRHPTAILKISDPGGIEESLTLTFSSSDSNNSQYAIKMLARELGAQLEVTVKDQQVPPDDEMPF
jgi:flavodoxin